MQPSANLFRGLACANFIVIGLLALVAWREGSLQVGLLSLTMAALSVAALWRLSRFELVVGAGAPPELASVPIEAQLLQSRKMEAIGTLAGGIAHDFNNALAVILGSAELARQDAMDNPQVLDSLEEIRKAGNRARNLVQQILSFSRRQPFERRPIDLASVVSKCTGLLRSTLPARIEIAMEIESGDFRVMADATQIEQLLINLATNAMQAIPTGPGRIDIQLQKTTLDAGLAAQHASLQAMYARCSGPVARLSVGDTGAGMDAGTLTRIFEPFFTTKALGEGTGLGLSVVHGIVQGHDGAVVVESDLGKGTRFSIYLALDDAVNVRGSTDH